MVEISSDVTHIIARIPSSTYQKSVLHWVNKHYKLEYHLYWVVIFIILAAACVGLLHKDVDTHTSLHPADMLGQVLRSETELVVSNPSKGMLNFGQNGWWRGRRKLTWSVSCWCCRRFGHVCMTAKLTQQLCPIDVQVIHLNVSTNAW